METAYFYTKDTVVKLNEKTGWNEEHYTVIKSTAKTAYLAWEKAKQWAALEGIKLAGGSWTSRCRLPYNFDTNYTVLTLPKHFKAKKHRPDFMDRLIAYEQGDMDGKQQKAFISELRKTGIGRSLQGHYSSRM